MNKNFTFRVQISMLVFILFSLSNPGQRVANTYSTHRHLVHRTIFCFLTSLPRVGVKHFCALLWLFLIEIQRKWTRFIDYFIFFLPKSIILQLLKSLKTLYSDQHVSDDFVYCFILLWKVSSGTSIHNLKPVMQIC